MTPRMNDNPSILDFTSVVGATIRTARLQFISGDPSPTLRGQEKFLKTNIQLERINWRQGKTGEDCEKPTRCFCFKTSSFFSLQRSNHSPGNMQADHHSKLTSNEDFIQMNPSRRQRDGEVRAIRSLKPVVP